MNTPDPRLAINPATNVVDSESKFMVSGVSVDPQKGAPHRIELSIHFSRREDGESVGGYMIVFTMGEHPYSTIKRIHDLADNLERMIKESSKDK